MAEPDLYYCSLVTGWYLQMAMWEAYAYGPEMKRFLLDLEEKQSHLICICLQNGNYPDIPVQINAGILYDLE